MPIMGAADHDLATRNPAQGDVVMMRSAAPQLIAGVWVDDLAYWAGTVSIGSSGSAAHSWSEAV